MAGGPLTRALTRVASAATALGLAAAIAHSALAAPSRQSDPVISEIRQQVAQVRGLESTAETPVVSQPRASLVARLSKEFNTQRTIREFLTSQMLLEVLGAMPRGFDLRQLQLNLLEEQTTAVYDYDDRVIYLVAEAAGDLGAEERLVLAHEFTHALQDQHFGLRRVLPANPQNSDADAAARALVEGDAMLTMRIWGRQSLRPSDKRSLGDEPTKADPVLDAAPALVRGELLFPYDAGWVFAQLLYQDGGYEAVDRAFANPPRSTEQILHPEKYTAGEGPINVTISPLDDDMSGTWKTLRTDTFGELVLRLLLEPNIGWPDAEAAAAGWGGDAYTILEDSSGRRIVGMVTVWDTDEDAAEMYNAWVANVETAYKSAAVRTVTQPSVARWTTPEYQVQALKTGNVVRIVYAPDANTLDQVEAQLSAATVGGSAAPAPRPNGAPSTGPSSAPGAAPSPPAVPPTSASPTAIPATTSTATPTAGPAFEPVTEPAVRPTSVPAATTVAPTATAEPTATPAPDDDSENDND